MRDIEDLATSIISLGAPEGALADKLRLHVADVLGAWIAARATEEGQRLIAYKQHLSAMTGASSPLDEIGLNCALARLSEVDDIHIGAMITAGAVAVPTAFGLAASVRGCERSDLGPAIIAGYEAMVRMGRTIDGPRNLFRGIWISYFAAPLGAAAVAVRMLKLDKREAANALAAALTMSAPSVGDHDTSSTTRWWSFGQAVRNGISAAMAARAGFTADLNILRSKLLPGIFGITPDLAAMSDIDVRTLALSEVSFKPWCAARQTMAATQALREVMAQGVSPESIASIQAFVVPLHVNMIGQSVVKEDRSSFLKSLSYQMAIAALMPERRFDLRPAPEMPTSAVQEFMTRIVVSADQDLMAAYPRQWAARVVVETRDGARHEHRVDDVPGDPARPIRAAELASKFRRLVASAGVDDPDYWWAYALRLLDPAGDERLPIPPFMLDAIGVR